jgi:hypothetical protein
MPNEVPQPSRFPREGGRYRLSVAHEDLDALGAIMKPPAVCVHE